MKRLITLMIILALGSSVISCSDDFAAVEKNVIESSESTDGSGNNGTSGGSGGSGSGGN